MFFFFVLCFIETKRIGCRFADFKRGHTNDDDAKRSGCPNSALLLVYLGKVHKIVLEDRKVKLSETASSFLFIYFFIYTVEMKRIYDNY